MVFEGPQTITNLLTNPNTFKSTSGWISKNEITFELYPPFTKDTDILTYDTTSFLKLKNTTVDTYDYIYNSGL